MSIIDLSHPISKSMPYYPGTEPPDITSSATVSENGYAEKRICLLTHNGTHVDAPAHIIQGKTTIDNIKPDNFFGSAIMLDFSKSVKKTIDLKDLLKYKEAIEKNDFVLLNTGWCHNWGKEKYFKNFPTLSEEAAQWLCGFKLKGVGVDTISVDAVDSIGYPIHKLLLSHGINIIENLSSLDHLPRGRFLFCCFPLRIKNGDGSPVRAVAFTDTDLQKGMA